MTSLIEQILAVHESLTAAELPHAFGGAFALAFCISEARTTQDIDVNVFVAPEEAARVLAALPRGVVVTATDRRHAERDGQVRLMWERTPLDVFFAYHAFHLHAAGRTRDVPFAGTTLPVLSCTDLAVFKAFFARTKDWADIESMAAASTVDEREALQWVADLLGTASANYQRLAAALQEPPPKGPTPTLRDGRR